MCKVFDILVGQIQSKLIYRFVTSYWPVHKLQVCKLVFMEFDPPEWQNFFTSNINNLKNKNMQMDIFCYFDFLHRRRNALRAYTGQI